MATKRRKSISEKTRFEVFKRDSFKCQYCGRPAPDVILELDHVKPIAKGGPDDLLNYVTSCRDCNQGKGARELGDQTEIERQRRQLEDLNERRLQLEEMLRWREGLTSLHDMKADALIQRIKTLGPGWEPNESGVAAVRSWLRKYSFEELLDAAESSAHSYLRWEDRKVTQDSWSKFFDMIPRVAEIGRAVKDEPYLRDLLYVRAILRNKDWPWWAQQNCMPLLKSAVAAGISVEDLKRAAKTSDAYNRFSQIVERWIREARGGKV